MSSPSHFKKLVVTSLSRDFRNSTAVVDGHLPDEVPEGKVRLAVKYAGVNASDLNFANGSYFKETKLPFDCGFEAVGTVVKVGHGVTNLKEGDAVAVMQYGAFAEFIDAPALACALVPDAKPENVVLPVSALTAAVALGEVGYVKKGEVALVTAAAGGTGQIAVQLLKHVYGCTVIGTCSSAEKTDFLKKIGCDHVINYKTENVDDRLRELAPNGVNVVYECVGGQIFNEAVRRIAVHGRIIVIGTVSSYKTGEVVPFSNPRGVSLPMALLGRSASLNGFFLPHFHNVIPRYTKEVLAAVEAGQVKLFVDQKVFKGIGSVVDAVDHLYSGTSYGKVVVQIQ
ncbi:putative oxidoreductase [Leptomonas pyrrhocoris]|uniref:Putative oxidoreductase n=1 Tax=Leptomonas pyrrhocoris TaxID=157538 RepID=A0A0M9G3G0_LEPPY|nr:putative oxidoreductase [Leptomonas pyrrhocoris]XP_015659903.1 putative oxidoreductase [Leptomonas pyrrhocoris]KPA81463.1 putative oxidoreductase [Leptomonas pyrrhocoris]KPA81464.1 putative oxidoreductase [Leptomonas pyrrhocoris]|eukprot:XP_015659902.1 putative oxidoreductase [Leptomonas pyrrhocoris]